jgi:CBS domain-containing protein
MSGRMKADGPGELSLFRRRIRELIKLPPVTCALSASTMDVARRLSREGVGSVVVVDTDGAPVGIVTDRDLRRKIVAEGRDPVTTPAREIMSSPLITLPPTAFAFEAVLEMTRHRIRHVVLVEAGRLIGVVSSRDFLALQTTHPVTLAREITRAVSFDALAGLAARVTTLVRGLVDEGGTAYDIGQIVAELNDRIVVRVQGLVSGALEEAGEEAPPVRYCWLAFGSEARREQTLRTDQDNGLLYEDPPPHLAARAAEYYAKFADAVIQGLVHVGFPRCPGDAMASNPTWRQPLSIWEGYFRRWMGDVQPAHVLAACIYFDLRPLGGAAELAARLLDIVRVEAPQHHVFLRYLAADVASRRLPVTIFGNLSVDRSGPHRGALDVKKAGGLHLVGAGRVYNLALSLGETSTVDRIRAAAARGVFTDAEARDITDAFQHLVRLRLVHQLEQLALGEAPDNYISPSRLSRADALLMRDAMRTVSRVQAEVRERFATDLVSV